MHNINETLSENTKAILMLTNYFNNNELRQIKPLTINGYGYFARWLNTYGYQPMDLLNQSKLDEILDRWQEIQSHEQVKNKVKFTRIDQTIKDITPERIKTLLARGASLSMALERWSSVGVWIIDRGHRLYPSTFKLALKDQAPAVLFGIGNPELLAKPAIGFVGSRNADELDLSATSHYVSSVSELGYQVVSGGAKGIDSHAMLSSLEKGNTSLGIIADNLLLASVNAQWRKYLKSNQLALITPFYPESKFTPANAMQRNKYIYLLSRATIVVCATESTKSKKSGTFEGAKENLKNNWVPLLVSDHKKPLPQGNSILLVQSNVTKISLDMPIEQLHKLVAGENSQADDGVPNNQALDSKQEDLFGEAIEEDSQALDSIESDSVNEKSDTDSEKTVVNEDLSNPLLSASVLVDTPLLNVFYEQLKHLFETHTNTEIQETLTLSAIESHFPEFEIMGKTALDKWLKYLVDKDLIVRPKKNKKEFCLPRGDKNLSD